jgi:hypothetical protein
LDPSYGRSDNEGQKKIVENLFERRIFLGDKAIAALAGGTLSGVDPQGFVVVGFSGRSQTPLKAIPLEKPRAELSKAGAVVLSGKVAAGHLVEIGHEVGPINQTDIPPANHDYQGKNWLNVSLGRVSAGFNTKLFAQAVQADGALELSPVSTINGHSVDPNRYDLEELWHHAERAATVLPYRRF